MVEKIDYNEWGFPEGWEDSAIVSSIKRNKDGTITVHIQVNVDGNSESEHWETSRTLRMQRKKL